MLVVVLVVVGLIVTARRTGCRLWSTFGCETAGWDVAAGVVECRCNHTSNFAILMQVVPFEVRRPGETVDTLLHHTRHTLLTVCSTLYTVHSRLYNIVLKAPPPLALTPDTS